MNICRTCAAESCEELVPIFSKLDDKFIANVIVDCSAVTINEDDGLPSYVCSICLASVKEILRFAEKVRESDRKLRLLLKGESSNPSGVKKQEQEPVDDTFTIIPLEVDLTEVKLEIEDDDAVEQGLKQGETNVLESEQESEDSEDGNDSDWKGDGKTSDDEPVEEKKVATRRGRSKTAAVSASSDQEDDKPKRRRRWRPKKVSDDEDDEDSDLDEVEQKTYKIVQTEPGRVFCCLCFKDFETRDQLVEHGKAKHSKKVRKVNYSKKYVCDVCYCRYITKESLDEHLAMAEKLSKRKIYECLRCANRFNTVKRRRIHAHNHPKYAEVPDPDLEEKRKRAATCCKKGCYKKFPTKDDLIEHGKKEHFINRPQVKDPAKPHECPVCYKCFEKLQSLKRHRYKMFDTCMQCSVCGKEFKSRNSMITHERKHNNEKPFACEICGKRFAIRNQLKNHMAVHQDERPFVCSECGWSFKRECNLKIHSLQHSNTLPWKCDVCGKCFKGKYHLQYHLRTHTGHKPWKCRYCEKSFADHANRARHETSHTDSTADYSTNICTNPSNGTSPTSKPLKKNKVTPKSYSESDLDNILTSIRNSVMTVNYASTHYGIPRGTLQYRLSNRFKNKGTTGPYTVFTNKEEQDIVNYLKDMERKGFPITRKSLIHRISCFLKENPRVHPFKNDKPGKGWFRGFMSRHKDLALRTPESITSASSKVSEKDIRGWFQMVWSYLMDHNLLSILDDPSRVLNGDESGFCLNPVANEVLVTKGQRNVSIVETGSSKQNITVMFSFCADGSVLPPDVILAQKRLSRELIQSFPREWGLGTSENGWMDTKNFVLYIKKIVHPFLVKKGVSFPVIYFVDGHKSHTAIEAADACRKLGIILIALFPNSTRILQPADVAGFKPLKNSWTNVIDMWKASNMTAPVTLCNFGSLLQDAMNNAFKECTIIHGFSACGLYPFNPNAVDYSKCITKNVYEPYFNSDASPFEVQDETLEEEAAQEKIIQEENAQNTVQEKIYLEETVIVKTIQEETTQEENTHHEVNDLVPARAVEEALVIIGPSKLQMYETEDEESFSHEDKAFIFKNILKQEAVVLESVVPVTGVLHGEETTNSDSPLMDITEQPEHPNAESDILRSRDWTHSSCHEKVYENLDGSLIPREAPSLADVNIDLKFSTDHDQTLAEGSRWTSSPNVGITEAVKLELTEYVIAPATP